MQAVVGGSLNLIGDLAGQVWSDVVEPVDRIAAARGQPRIRRRRDVVLGPVTRLHGEVSRDVLPVEPTLVVLHLDRHAVQQLLLDGDADLGIPGTQTVEQLIAVGQTRIQRAEVLVGEDAAKISSARAKVLTAGVLQVTVHHVVPVRVGPRPRGIGHDRGCWSGAGEDSGVLCWRQVLAPVHFQRRLPVAEHVVGGADSRSEVLEIDSIRARNDRGDRNEPRAADV